MLDHVNMCLNMLGMTVLDVYTNQVKVIAWVFFPFVMLQRRIDNNRIRIILIRKSKKIGVL